MTTVKGNTQQNMSVPYIVHESDMARLAKANEQLMKSNKALQEENKSLHKTLRILIIVFFFTLFLSFVAFMVYESQFETVTEAESSSESNQTSIEGDISQDAEDGSNTLYIVGGDNENG